jgi:hypothetical protein
VQARSTDTCREVWEREVSNENRTHGNSDGRNSALSGVVLDRPSAISPRPCGHPGTDIAEEWWRERERTAPRDRFRPSHWAIAPDRARTSNRTG